MREVCGNCKHNKRDFSKPQNSCYSEFCCGNEDSDNYGVPTFYDDACDDFEEKEWHDERYCRDYKNAFLREKNRHKHVQFRNHGWKVQCQRCFCGQ